MNRTLASIIKLQPHFFHLWMPFGFTNVDNYNDETEINKDKAAKYYIKWPFIQKC